MQSTEDLPRVHPPGHNRRGGDHAQGDREQASTSTNAIINVAGDEAFSSSNNGESPILISQLDQVHPVNFYVPNFDIQIYQLLRTTITFDPIGSYVPH